MLPAIERRWTGRSWIAAALMTGLGRLKEGGGAVVSLSVPANDTDGRSFTIGLAAVFPLSDAIFDRFVVLSSPCGVACLLLLRMTGALDDRTTVADGATPPSSDQPSIISALDACSLKAGWASTWACCIIFLRSCDASSEEAPVALSPSSAARVCRCCCCRSLCALMASSLLRIRSARLVAAAVEDPAPPPRPPARRDDAAATAAAAASFSRAENRKDEGKIDVADDGNVGIGGRGGLPRASGGLFGNGWRYSPAFTSLGRSVAMCAVPLPPPTAAQQQPAPTYKPKDPAEPVADPVEITGSDGKKVQMQGGMWGEEEDGLVSLDA